MRPRWLMLLAVLLLLSPMVVLGQGKSKATSGQKTAEQAKTAKHGKSHWWQLKKKGKNKGKKDGKNKGKKEAQKQAVSGKKSSK